MSIQTIQRADGRTQHEGRGGISAVVIEHTRVGGGADLYTLQLRYPRFIHSEFMTHRVFSRNASSSRAIPVARMLEQVRNDPAMPIEWGKNQPGMQAKEVFTGADAQCCEADWRRAAKHAADVAEAMNAAGVHKQIVNRILEPFQFINVIVTATEWGNFLDLRDHEDAQPEIHELARCILEAIYNSRARIVDGVRHVDLEGSSSSWHLPYISAEERLKYRLPILLACSAARCARVSYLKHDGSEPSIEEDIKLFERLVGSEPLHASPIEHQAIGASNRELMSGNLRGFHQFRKEFELKSDYFKLAFKVVR